MGLVLLALAVVGLAGARYCGRGIQGEYMSIPQTTAIKGIFVVLVFLRHYKGYVALEGVLDRPFLVLDGKLGQLIVALFLFYSGYGLYESYRKKGRDYVRTIPKKRFLATLLHFDLAVLLYVLIQAVLMGRFYGWKQILLSLTGWTSVGNSNWFIFAILVMYLFSWAALRLIPSRVGQLCAVTALSAAYAVVFHHYYPDIWWWYDTILCYATGMWFAFFRPQIERFLSGELRFWVSFGALLVLFRVLFYYRNSLAVYEALAVVFCLLGVLVSMKVKVGNRVLDWLGRQVFTVYILQRLPMMLLEQWGLSAYPYAFFAASLALTLGLAAGFDWLLKRFDRYVLKIPEKK